jgi:cellulose synthase/poly-beta-1,6-N-acetylglucosamine synthase-like glycosyltransferase
MRFAFAKSSTRDSQPARDRSGTVKFTQPHTSNSPVSLIVCSKNEAKNLRINIPKWLDQDYPELQLVLINDASTDQTKDVIELFAASDKRITVVNVENNEAFWGSKKYALTLGIKRAKHKILVFTDADCVPASRQWLQRMANAFKDKKELVLGYGAYKKIKGSFLNSLIRFETLFTALQYFGYAQWGRAYMGVGRNLGYTADLFYEQSGFINHIDIQSGDDDLFVNGASTSQNTALCCHKDSFTISEPKTSFAAWSHRKDDT